MTSKVGFNHSLRVNVCLKSCNMPDIFKGFSILPESMGKLVQRTIELNEAEQYNEMYSYGSTIYDILWEMLAIGGEATGEYISDKADKEKRRSMQAL